MSVKLKENPKKKIEYILSLARTGMTREEIAEEMGYKDKGNLDTFMRRKDMVWNPNKRLYVLKGEKEDKLKNVIEDIQDGKVARIISKIENGIDAKEVAMGEKFKDPQEMADYLKSKGYLWDNKFRKYRKSEIENKKETRQAEPVNVNQTNSCDCMNQYGDLLSFLSKNKDKLENLIEMVQEQNSRIPTYNLSGVSTTKSVTMVSTLDQLIKDFGEEKNMKQSKIVETALIEFFKKYGYGDRVKTLLHID